MKITFIVLLVTASLLPACQPNYQNRDAALAVHDEIMPKMEVFMQHSMHIDTLLSHLDSLHQMDSGIDTIALSQTLHEAKEQIKQSNDAMNDWMHAFELEPQGNKAQIEAYFLQQKNKIDSVNSLYQQTTLKLKSIDLLN